MTSPSPSYRGYRFSPVLNAAALTYVAAVVSTLLTLLYFLMRAGFLGDGTTSGAF